MKAIEDILFDGRFGSNDSFNNGIPLEVLNNIAADPVGGGGGGVSAGGGSSVIITNTPGTSLSDETYLVNIDSDIPNASILVNGENIFKTTKHLLKVNISDILTNGDKVITIQKDGYTIDEKYVITLGPNPNYNLNINFNLGSSILGGMGGNFGVSGLSMFNSLPTIDTRRPEYSTTPFYLLNIKHYKNGFEQNDISNDAGNLKNISFTFNKKDEEPILIPKPIDVIEVGTFSLDGEDGSAEILIEGGVGLDTEIIPLKKGINEIIIPNGNKVVIRANNSNIRNAVVDLIRTQSVKTSRITEIVVSADGYDPKTLLAENENETISTSLTLDKKYLVSIKTQTFTPVIVNSPVISFVNQEDIKNYNINSESDFVFGIYKNENTTGVKVNIANESLTFSQLQTGNASLISIPKNKFSKVGKYRVIVTPFNSQGDGDVIEFILNVKNDVYVGVPDVRNIQYPSLIKGPDYVGTNVNFNISYESVNTDYVRIYPLGSSQFIKSLDSGNIILNFQQLLALPGAQYSESNNLINLTLKLVPYNEQGNEVVVGKEELITIQFDKSQITIPRNLVINRLVDGFFSQLDTSSIDEHTSKYLTYLLHLDGDSKLITTWLGSEGSLIAKLYEPLPTSVQPNQQVWISKLQSEPIVETISISGVSEAYCPPLKGPNFSLDENNGVAYQILDDLIASGSQTSNDLINKYLEGTNVDTTKLNLEYVSGSTYTFENFSHFGSAEERVANFFYKVQLLENYKAKYEELIATTFIPPYEGFSGGILTENGYQIITEDGLFDVQWEIAQTSGVSQAAEAQKLLNTINGILRNFDGFENFLYKSNNDLAYPKETYTHPITGLTTYILKSTTNASVTAWYDSLTDLAAEYDLYNPNYLVNNIPEFIREDYNNNDFVVFLDMIGQHFDILWAYIKALDNNKVLEHKQVKGISNTLVSQMLQSFGWNPKNAFNSPFLWEYAFGKTKEGFQKYGMPLADANDEVWRRILNNLPYLLKHKGTARAMKAIMACYGVPQSMLTIMEFGGPQDPTLGGSSKFTFDDRTAAFYLSGSLNGNGSSHIKIPWHDINGGDYPNCIEFRILPSELPNTKYSLISGSEWSLDLVRTTGSFGKIELNFGGDESTGTYFDETLSNPATYYISYINGEPYAYGPDLKTGSLDFPISTEHYSQVVINRHNNPDSSSWFEVWLGTSDGQRIITSVSMSLLTDDTQWETGSYLQIGGNGFSGNLDEFRLWKVPLQRSKFENHTLFPDAINGNSYTASTSDLVFRLDFEYPKDRVLDPYIKNVSISEIYGEGSATASNMYSAATYPYQYIPYDRTVTATVPSLGFNYSNKVRFESASLVTDLSYKQRATKKAFDRAPIDSNRLGLFFSPIKELNMDILKAFGDFNIDNYIGDPRDEYKDKYTELDTLRGYYFERLENRDIYEYIRLIKYIDRSLFDTLIELAPARTNISKGLLIEPHYLERSKIQWSKPTSEKNNFETFIDTRDNVDLVSDYLVEEVSLDATNVAELEGGLNNYETIIDIADTNIEGTNPTYNAEIFDVINSELEASVPTYECFIQVPTGSSLSGEADSFKFEEIGMDRNSLANRGFGLYSKNGVAKINYFDSVFGNHTSSRSNVYVVKEQYIKKIDTQIQGYPTTRSLTYPNEQVKYAKVPVVNYRYKVTTLAFSGSVSIGNEIVSVETIKGYLPTHYRYTHNLSEGLQRSYWKGSVQNEFTTPDGLSPVEIFTTNPNILRVAKTGRGSGEPILEVD